VRSPQSLGGSAVQLHLTVPDVDALTDRAIAAGATLLSPLADQMYGHRTSKLADPFGYNWMLSTVIEDVSPEEVQRRYAKSSGSR
jgi:PhnB protein